MRPKGACEHNAVHFIHAKLIHQEPRAGIERGFGHLNGADIRICDGNFGSALGAAIIHHIAVGAPVSHAARGSCLLCRTDQPGWIQNSRHAHFGNGLYDA